MLVDIDDYLVYFNSKDKEAGISVVSLTPDYTFVVHDSVDVPEAEFLLDIGVVKNTDISKELQEDMDKRYTFTTMLDDVDVSCNDDNEEEEE